MQSDGLTTDAIHKRLHEALECGDVLAFVNSELAKRNHQRLEYGDIPSGLHLHYLLHALEPTTRVYIEIDGTMREACEVYRPKDSIGRRMAAVVIKA